MARRKSRVNQSYFQALGGQDFLITTSFFCLVITSIIFISGVPKPGLTPAGRQMALAVNNYQTRPKRQMVQDPLPQVLAAETTQPGPETWQGPIEPLPDDPNQPSLPVLSQIPTSEPVVFLGIDDGWVHNPDTLNWLLSHRLPFTMFLTDNGIKSNYGYFQQLQSAGLTVEDHTLSHPNLTKMPLDQQRAEICGAADTYGGVFGVRPTLFRPPYGKANQVTLQAAQECGMRAVIMWHALVQNGALQYQDGLTHLQPGDIVLMHFTNNFQQDIQAFMNQITADNLQVGRLEDWLP